MSRKSILPLASVSPVVPVELPPPFPNSRLVMATPPTYRIETHAPLPATLSPTALIQSLHTIEPILAPNPRLVSFTGLPGLVDLVGEDVEADFVFATTTKTTNTTATPAAEMTVEDGAAAFSRYEIREHVPILLGWGFYVTFTALFQRVEDGVRARVRAPGGTTVRAVYCVRRREGEDGWELVETASVTCSGLLRVVVVREFEAAHRELCGGIVRFVEEQQRKQQEEEGEGEEKQGGKL